MSSSRYANILSLIFHSATKKNHRFSISKSVSQWINNLTKIKRVQLTITTNILTQIKLSHLVDNYLVHDSNIGIVVLFITPSLVKIQRVESKVKKLVLKLIVGCCKEQGKNWETRPNWKTGWAQRFSGTWTWLHLVRQKLTNGVRRGCW